VPLRAKNEQGQICGLKLKQKSYLGRRHIFGQIVGSIGSREYATWTKEEHKSQPPWARGDAFCNQRDCVDAVKNMAQEVSAT
jgi:hypothetical protein